MRRRSSQRGPRKGRVVGCDVVGAGNHGGVWVGVVPHDAGRTIRATMVSPAGSASRVVAHIADPAVVHDCAYVELLGAAGKREKSVRSPVSKWTLSRIIGN